MALDFVAIDFETADFTRTSACSVNVAPVEGGVVRGSTGWLIGPSDGPYFTHSFVHGVTEAHLIGGLSWDINFDPSDY